MASAKDQQTPTHYIVLPECASDFRSHADCPRAVTSVTGARIVCACVACHGTPQTADLCAGCNKPKPIEVVDDTVAVGNGSRTDSYIRRYCSHCRAAFLSDLQEGQK